MKGYLSFLTKKSFFSKFKVFLGTKGQQYNFSFFQPMPPKTSYHTGKVSFDKNSILKGFKTIAIVSDGSNVVILLRWLSWTGALP
jgi:hypothetical protein